MTPGDGRYSFESGAAVASLPSATRSPRFLGSGGAIFGVLLVNALLFVVTLGVYHFWGKAKFRRYVFSNIELDGARFDFHGTGREMFIGWLKVMGVFVGAGIMMGLANAVFGPKSMVPFLLLGLYYLGILFIIPFVIVAARRYLLSRTSWHGNRFSFRGDTTEFAKIFLKGFLLTMVTFGFYAPIFGSNMFGFLIGNTYYGTRRLQYDGDGRDLLLPYVKAFFLAFVTFGLSLLWYTARQTRYYSQHTTYSGVRFDSTVTGGRLLELAITNALLIVFTFGLATPWVIARNLDFHCRNLVLHGAVDFATIGAGSDPAANAMGEEMASALDVGAGF